MLAKACNACFYFSFGELVFGFQTTEITIKIKSNLAFFVLGEHLSQQGSFVLRKETTKRRYRYFN